MFASRATAVLVSTLALFLGALADASTALAWAWPVDGAVLREFSVGDDEYAAGQHRGIDIAIGGADIVRAPVSGEVTFAGQVPTHGLTVTIATSDGFKASLTHLGPIAVRRGARVAEGDGVAQPGPSGEPEHATPYVHLGVRVGADEKYVDPAALLPPRTANPPPAPVPTPSPAPSPVPSPPPAPPPTPPPPAAAEPAPTPAPAVAPTPAPAAATTPEPSPASVAPAPATGVAAERQVRGAPDPSAGDTDRRRRVFGSAPLGRRLLRDGATRTTSVPVSPPSAVPARPEGSSTAGRVQ